MLKVAGRSENLGLKTIVQYSGSAFLGLLSSVTIVSVPSHDELHASIS